MKPTFYTKKNTDNKILIGTKDDKGKPQLGLVPVEAIEAIARAMEYGIDKYSRGNCVNVEPERYINACLRHIYACQTPEGYDLNKTDEESGLKHIDHALACLSFIAATNKEH